MLWKRTDRMNCFDLTYMCSNSTALIRMCSHCLCRLFTLPFQTVHTTFLDCSQCLSRLFILPFQTVHISFPDCSHHLSRLFTPPFQTVHTAFPAISLLLQLSTGG